MKFLKTLNEIIKKIEKMIIAYGIILIAIVLIYNVFTRSILGFSWKAAEEMCSFLVVAVTFLSVSYAARTGKHITMTVALDLLPVKGKKIMLTVASFLCMVSLLWITQLCYSYVLYVESMGRITPALEIPAWIPLVVMPVGFLLSAIQYGICFVLNIRYRDRVYIGSEAVYGNAEAEITL